MMQKIIGMPKKGNFHVIRRHNKIKIADFQVKNELHVVFWHRSRQKTLLIFNGFHDFPIVKLYFFLVCQRNDVFSSQSDKLYFWKTDIVETY